MKPRTQQDPARGSLGQVLCVIQADALFDVEDTSMGRIPKSVKGLMMNTESDWSERPMGIVAIICTISVIALGLPWGLWIIGTALSNVIP